MNNQNEYFPRVFIITLNWNGRDDTIECIASLMKLNYSNYNIVVVDNGSTDDSVTALREKYKDIVIIENGRNLGYAEGFNTGMRFAAQKGADYFLILNNDTVIDPDALKELVCVAEGDYQIGFLTGKVYFYDDPQRIETAGKYQHPISLVGDRVGNNEIDEGQYDEVREYKFVDDVFLLVRRSVFEKVGGYDPIFFLMFEEADWCARVLRAGFKILYTPKAKIWHKGNKGLGTGRSPIHQFYLARNQIPFIFRNASRRYFRKFLLSLLFSYKWPWAPRQLWWLLKAGKYRLLWAYLRGISSGLIWFLRNRNNSSTHV